MCRLICVFVVVIGLKCKYIIKFKRGCLLESKNCIVAMSTRENPISIFLNKNKIPFAIYLVREINIGEVYENKTTC